MRRKTQILLIPCLTIGLCAVSTTASICVPVIKNEIFLNKIVNESINTFKYDLCPIYRATFHTRKIADYLIKYISDLGFEVHEDDYKPEESADYSGNLYYDIPASKNCENWSGVTLQAHMDMVCEYDDKQGEYDWSKGVDIIQEGNILHSRNNWTSIGADDGIGLSLILSLSKHHKEFTHGPIHVVITADEEDGDSGASALTAESIKYDNIINIDGEVLGEITKSCAGTYCNKYKIFLNSWQTVSTGLDQYAIIVNGFNGGHSATEIDKGGSAIKAANDLLLQLQQDANVELLQFTSINNNNAIAKLATLSIATDKANMDSWIADQKSVLKTKYPKDINLDVTCVKLEEGSKFNYSLNADITSKCSYVVDKIFYGVKNWLSEKEIETSSNIGPINLVNNATSWTIEALIRSVYAEKEEELATVNKNYVASVFDSIKVSNVETPTWEFKEEVPLVDLVAKGFKQSKIEPYIAVSHGWLECAFFAQKRPNAEIVSIGPNIKDAHNPTESCDITSIKPCLKTVLYALANIQNK